MIAADPYPWPYDGDIRASRLAVVVAGAQRAWVDRSVGTPSVGAAIAAVTGAARRAGTTVVHVRHGAPGPRRCGLPPVPGEAAWHLAAGLGPGDLVVDAGGVDGFHASPLDATLRAGGVTHLVLCGYGAEAAVDSTLRSANDRGYECLVLSDAVAPFSPELGARALASVTMSGGIFGAVAPSAALVAALAPPAPAAPSLVPEPL